MTDTKTRERILHIHLTYGQHTYLAGQEDNVLAAMSEYSSHQNKELLERIKELEDGLSDSLQIMEQTLAYRDHVGLDGGNIFIEYAINNAKQLLNNKTDKG